ncbi:low molecular weight phosphatase family protein [Streptomyces sp. NPDC014864]|uniref:arsenate reductase/protein-tyrosine-phosphatase family protein n=1 Tax=Streptomyces sp. NPDC014864 TaxID=3364924 RepID=UPI00370233CC
MTRVLFVCTGNVHRSVLAERLLAARLRPGSAVRPESAGTEAWPAFGMNASTKEVLEKLGGDGSGFSARPLTAQLVAQASLVLGLAREHREAAVRLVPSALRRCFTLKEFVRLATGEAGRVRSGGQGRADHGSAEAVVAAAAARRGIAAPVPPAGDDFTDPVGRPWDVLYGCAREIDDEVGVLAALLEGGPLPPRQFPPR